jgi:hypothetical protein
MSRDLERKLRTDLTRAILELEAPPSAQEDIRRTELSQLSIEDLRAVLKAARGTRIGKRGKNTAPDIVIEAMLASEEEWLTMSEIADQARAIGHKIETERVSTALANLEFAHGRGRGVHAGYGVEVVRKQRPYLYRLVSTAEHELRNGGGVIYLVAIQDKDLYGDPDVALALIAAPDEQTACQYAGRTLGELAAQGRTNCVPHARKLELGAFYRPSTIVRLSQDLNVGRS